jgi:hypothetical protein
MPVILATQEAEIRRITVQSQPGQIVHETQSQKRAGGVAQGVGSGWYCKKKKKFPTADCQPGKHEALSSNPRATKKIGIFFSNTLVIFQELNSHRWMVDTWLNRADLGHFHYNIIFLLDGTALEETSTGGVKNKWTGRAVCD